MRQDGIITEKAVFERTSSSILSGIKVYLVRRALVSLTAFSQLHFISFGCLDRQWLTKTTSSIAPSRIRLIQTWNVISGMLKYSRFAKV